MRSAIAGGSGIIGQEVMKLWVENGQTTVSIDQTSAGHEHTSTLETRTVDLAKSYKDTLKAFQGCDAVIHLAAIPRRGGHPDWEVHANNVRAAFNGFRACGEVGIKKICYASSVNATDFVYSNKSLEAELQAQAFANWLPGTKITCLRVHQVKPKNDVVEHHGRDFEGAGLKNLWGWVNPKAVARVCLLSVERSDAFDGCEIFNIVAPDTTTEIPSGELMKKYFSYTEIYGDFASNQACCSTDKAERILGWKRVFFQLSKTPLPKFASEGPVLFPSLNQIIHHWSCCLVFMSREIVALESRMRG
ncbi:putative UDP-galactose 4-epimerase [Clohesyomyces aquaticus]|uniref:Putative UDP-galactose 4-epimerase n=1 Tax=Clohesyomyces aquaticus TaxID=1231657 RepID=A0A1Y1YU66_9PLEO|nr:putative UDP-galactose 4-epimerase [Clohesyomyces aquaticus]